MKKVLFFLFLFLIILDSEGEILGTFYKKNIKPEFPNSFFSYTIYSFKKSGTSLHIMYTEIYPEEGMRSVSKFGVLVKKDGDIYQFKFYQKCEMLLKKDGGLFSPFDGGGMIEISDDMKIKISELDNNIIINEQKFSSYKDDLKKAIESKDAKQVMSLYQFIVIINQSTVRDFGSIGMLKINTEFQGFFSGKIKEKFEGRGKGMGALSSNAGLLTQYKDYEIFDGVYVNGDFFGGKRRLEGQVNLNLEGKLDVNINYYSAKVYRGVASDGFYKINFPDMEMKVQTNLLPD